MRYLPDGSVALTWYEADALVGFFADAGKPAVAAWLRGRLDDLTAEGCGPGYEVVMGLKPDAEVVN